MDASLELGKKLGHHCVWPPGYHYFFFFRHISCILFGSLSGFVLLHGRNSGSSWPPRLALISLLFIVHTIKLIALVIPYLNLSPELD